MGPELEFFADPAGFLKIAGDHLAADPVVNTVVLTVAERLRDEPAEIPTASPCWFLVVRDQDGSVVGAGMRTAPFAPYPAFLLPMPDAAAVLLARAVHARGEPLGAFNGALPAVELCAAELARLGGGVVRVAQHTRLFRLDALVPPREVPGRLRPAELSDVRLAHTWFEDFMGAADEQAGRLRGASAHEAPDLEAIRRRIEGGRIFLWEVDGEVVHLTGVNPPASGAARIGPVYTPVPERGRGYASAAVAEISRRLLADGVVSCLFTDQANPTSNAIYEALGYRRVVDMANLVVDLEPDV